MAKQQFTAREFSWAAGHAYAVAPDVVAAELEHIAKRNKRPVTPHDFVAEARKARSVLHPLLPFDKPIEELAEAHLVQLAGNVIRALKITFTTPETKVVTMRALISVEQGGERGYVSLCKALSEKPLRDQMLADALRDAESFVRKYSDILQATGAGDIAERLVEALRDLLKGGGR